MECERDKAGEGYIFTKNPNDPCFDWKMGGGPSKIEVIAALGIYMICS